MTTDSPRHIQPYLARVRAPNGRVIGTAFQIVPGVLVTAWHVLEDSDAPDSGDSVVVSRFESDDDLVGTVLEVDREYDVATVRIEKPLDASVSELVSTWSLRMNEPLEIQGVAHIEDTLHDRTDVEMPGAWYGHSKQDDIIVGRMNADAVVGGMSGAPVRLRGTNRVVGVVTQQYHSGSAVMENSAWMALSDDLKRLVADLDVDVTSVPPPDGWKLTLTIDAERVTLSGHGPSISEPHHGVGHGLRERLHDVRRARANAGGLQRRLEGDAAPNPVGLAMTQVSASLSEAFLVGAVGERIAAVLKEATAENLPVRIGIKAEGALASLPWEALEAERGRGPLALHNLVTLVRQPKNGGEGFGGLPGPLRVLVVIASPENGSGAVLDYERELSEIVRAVKSARTAGAQVRVVEFGSLQAIADALEHDWFHVLHISSHGSPGALELEDQDGNVDVVDAGRLIGSIPAGRMPPVVTLAACYTAVPDDDGSSLALAFLNHGAKAVVATETSVTDRYATELASHLYKSLADGGIDVAAATAGARRAVQRNWLVAKDDRTKHLAALNEWSTVTLYTKEQPAFALRAGAPDDPLGDQRQMSQSIGGITGRNVWDLVGRRTARRQWPHEILGSAYAGMVIHGIGGVGKTTLAADIMSRIQTAEPGRVVVALTGQVDTDTLLAEARIGRPGPTKPLVGVPPRNCADARRRQRPPRIALATTPGVLVGACVGNNSNSVGLGQLRGQRCWHGEIGRGRPRVGGVRGKGSRGSSQHAAAGHQPVSLWASGRRTKQASVRTVGTTVVAGNPKTGVEPPFARCLEPCRTPGGLAAPRRAPSCTGVLRCLTPRRRGQIPRRTRPALGECLDKVGGIDSWDGGVASR